MFHALDPNTPTIFGFPEFLAGLALMVLAWTIADTRYRFRISTAPLPLQGITFGVVAVVGVLTLLTDLWIAETWLVPTGYTMSPARWQALLAGLVLATFLTWAWFGLIRPPRYSKANAERFAKALYHTVLNGSPTELAVIAEELAYSAESLIEHATDWDREQRQENSIDERSDVQAYADDILLILADKRLCRTMAETSPGTALRLFREISRSEKYGISIEGFARNFVAAAIRDKNSFIYHETDEFEAGLIGHHQPLLTVMYGNYKMVRKIPDLLSPWHFDYQEWDAAQWGAYCSLLTTAFRNYVQTSLGRDTHVLTYAIKNLENAVSDLYTLDGSTKLEWKAPPLARLRVVMDCLANLVKILNEKPVRSLTRKRPDVGYSFSDPYTQIAETFEAIIFAASKVQGPKDVSWWVQHNTVWGKVFHFSNLAGEAGDLIKFKLRRLLYNEIAEMGRFPNFKSATILGLCLNVLGLELSSAAHFSDSRALHKAVLSWTKKYYASLYAYNSEVAEDCLVEGMSYDVTGNRIVQTYPRGGLRRTAHYKYLELDPVVPGLIGKP
jgi:hypothetical protein